MNKDRVRHPKSPTEPGAPVVAVAATSGTREDAPINPDQEGDQNGVAASQEEIDRPAWWAREEKAIACAGMADVAEHVFGQALEFLKSRPIYEAVKLTFEFEHPTEECSAVVTAYSENMRSHGDGPLYYIDEKVVATFHFTPMDPIEERSF